MSQEQKAETPAGPGLEELLRRATRNVRPILVWCNSCVRCMDWLPSSDGSQCPECGYCLSMYGPFEEPPTLFPTPKPLEPSWRL